ncbi:MAG: bifunctional 4-hydroxy-2-oxoglutarate aldolase/2-dehydro-3-deoxy-phosphogluconate aldolase [Planctomycetes bacterium]|nr:bifunctional 4-hydroxy-2-oxoglutarate aldolase/2-dehydro-3-deoxy-phosphogluconate aldolase [Planctomycetota bacterium]
MHAPSSHPLLEVFERERCSAILRTPHARAVAPAMEAAIRGGFRIVEFTLNTPDALEHVAVFAERPELLVGCGTVLSTDDAERALAAGARFLVSPVADDDVIDLCVARGALCIPGVFTPAEMLRAHRRGAHVLKLFPGPVEGPTYLRSCRGPMPFLRIFPTSGVDLDNVAEYFAAGAFGVGFVNCLFEPDDLAHRRFQVIEARARRMIEAVRAATSRT